MSGIDLSSEPQYFSVEKASGTGYMWLHQVTPEGCATVEEVPIKQSVGRLMPGVKKTQLFKLTKQNVQEHCNITLALTRVWEFSGFNDDGSVADETTAITIHNIPLHLQ